MSAAAQPQRVLTGTRLSELAACPRRCACRALGHEAAEPPARQRRYLVRGQMFESYVALQFEAKYGKTAIERQREIPWALGTGHADIYIRPEKLIIEVVSTVGGNIDAKIRQARLYLMHDPEAETAAVYVVDPSSLDAEDLIPVHTDDHQLAELEERIAAVQAAIDGGPLPDCVHATPPGCRYSGCPFTQSAWADWQPPTPVDLSDTPGLVSLTADFYRAKQTREHAKAQLEDAESVYRDAKEALAEILALPKIPYRAGPFEVSRTQVAGRVTFSFARACETGAIPPAMQDALAPFVKVGHPHSRINIRRVSDEPVPDDWGAVPF